MDLLSVYLSERNRNRNDEVVIGFPFLSPSTPVRHSVLWDFAPTAGTTGRIRARDGKSDIAGSIGDASSPYQLLGHFIDAIEQIFDINNVRVKTIIPTVPIIPYPRADCLLAHLSRLAHNSIVHLSSNQSLVKAHRTEIDLTCNSSSATRSSKWLSTHREVSVENRSAARVTYPFGYGRALAEDQHQDKVSGSCTQGCAGTGGAVSGG